MVVMLPKAHTSNFLSVTLWVKQTSAIALLHQTCWAGNHEIQFKKDLPIHLAWGYESTASRKCF